MAKQLFDLPEIKHSLSILFQPTDIIEVRALDVENRPGSTRVGFFSDHEKAANAIASLSGRCTGVYILPNKIDADLLNRSANIMKSSGRNDCTSDSNVVERRWLLIDFDPWRKISGISSTDAEHKMALDKAQEAMVYLTDKLGFPKDSMILADSGNGAHILVRIDAPMTKETDTLIEDCLKALSFLFSMEKIVEVDKKVFNRARIWKAYGSLAHKGSDMPDRPHRLARILVSPNKLIPIGLDLLTKLANLKPEEAKPQQPQNNNRRPYGDKLDLAKWLPEHDIPIKEVSEWQGWTKYEPEHCPFDSAHIGSSVAFLQNAEGAIKFRCEHNSCAGREWKDVRALKDTDYAQRPMYQPGSQDRAVPSNDETTLQKRYNQTDTGNAELLRDLHSSGTRFDHRKQTWFHWNNHRYQPDTDGYPFRMGISTIRYRWDAIIRNKDLNEEDVKKETGWTKQSENKGRIEAMLGIASNLVPIADKGDSWDIDDMVLGVPNGAVDLRTGKLRSGLPSDRITKQSPITFDPKAKSPRWDKFLTEVFCDDTELIKWIQMACGYSLTGSTKEQTIFICFGNGANGKSKFLAALRHVLGDYAFDAPFSTFEAHIGSSVPNDLASLEGMRLVTSSETNDGTRLNEARLKSISGGDPITARFLHQEFFTFNPKLKLWLAVNYLPAVRDNSLGFWRRVRTIPFNRTFQGNGDDKDILEKLYAEGPGILNWFIEGALRWQKEGLIKLPEKITGANKEYKDDSNILFAFTGEMLLECPGVKIAAGELYRQYKKWSSETGLMEKEVLTSSIFGRIMAKQYKRTTVNGIRYYHDIAVKGAPVQTGFNDEVDTSTGKDENVPNF